MDTWSIGMRITIRDNKAHKPGYWVGGYKKGNDPLYPWHHAAPISETALEMSMEASETVHDFDHRFMLLNAVMTYDLWWMEVREGLSDEE